MNQTRREFAKSGLAALGFMAMDGMSVFAPLPGHPLRGQPSAGGYAPAGWKPSGKPKLVFGVVSDTHIRTAWDGKSPYWRFPLKYFKSALEYFRKSKVDAVVHCGDFAHRGMAASMQFHADTWRDVFGKSGGPAKLLVTGNHDIEGWTYNNFGGGIFPDAEERSKYIMGAKTAEKWERIWGERYEKVWHKVVNGYHFVGQHWGEESADNPNGAAYVEMEMAKFLDEHSAEPWMSAKARPFFLIRHVAPGPLLSSAINKYPNAIVLFGHAHGSAAKWFMARLHRGNAVIEVPSCEPRGTGGLAGIEPSEKAKAEGAEAAGSPRAGYVIRVYEDVLVVERREFGDHGGSLGPDWVIPIGENLRDSFTLEARKAVIGKPEFPKGAKLEVGTAQVALDKEIDGKKRLKTPGIRLTIPNANGNPQSRVYAYEVVIVGENPKVKLFKCVFAEGVNLAYGREPDCGITTLKIPNDQLPAGKKLTIGVRPLSSLGTKGKSITATLRV